MKKLTLAALMACAGLTGVNAHAATATGNFDVSITLNSKCQFNASAAIPGVIDALSMTYDSFQTTPANGATNFQMRCTNGLSYTLALDATSHTDDLLKLDYTLSFSNTATVGSVTGTGAAAGQSFTVYGEIAANQAGTCATASCTNGTSLNKTRTLTVTY